MKKTQPIFAVLAASVLVCSVLLSGCGYSIHGHDSLPFTEISIGMVENKTYEPKLQDILHRALTEEFTKQGIVVTPGAKLKLLCVVHSLNLDTLAEKSGVTKEYRVTANVTFTLIDDSVARKKQDENVSSSKQDETASSRKQIDPASIKQQGAITTPFFVSFTAYDQFGKLLAAREVAQQKAMYDIAMQIVSALIYK